MSLTRSGRNGLIGAFAVLVGFLALFLGFTKRRQEAILEEDEAAEKGTRPVLEHYSLPFLDQMIAMVTAQ